MGRLRPGASRGWQAQHARGRVGIGTSERGRRASGVPPGGVSDNRSWPDADVPARRSGASAHVGHGLARKSVWWAHTLVGPEPGGPLGWVGGGPCHWRQRLWAGRELGSEGAGWGRATRACAAGPVGWPCSQNPPEPGQRGVSGVRTRRAGRGGARRPGARTGADPRPDASSTTEGVPSGSHPRPGKWGRVRRPRVPRVAEGATISLLPYGVGMGGPARWPMATVEHGDRPGVWPAAGPQGQQPLGSRKPAWHRRNSWASPPPVALASLRRRRLHSPNAAPVSMLALMLFLQQGLDTRQTAVYNHTVDT